MYDLNWTFDVAVTSGKSINEGAGEKEFKEAANQDTE